MQVEQLEPISESTGIWNSIDAPEERKIYYALLAKALFEIDTKLEKTAKKKLS